MARLSDFPQIVKQIGFTTLAKRVWAQVGEDSVFTWGSALAYSWLFAIFPFLVFLLSLVPLIPTQYKSQAEDQVQKWADQAVPSPEAAKVISDQVKTILKKPAAGGFLSFGLVLTLWAA